MSQSFKEVKIAVLYNPHQPGPPLSVAPENAYVYTGKAPAGVSWHLLSADPEARISRIEFAGEHKAGPLTELSETAKDPLRWSASCASTAAAGEYKYSVFLRIAGGKEIELDPKMIVDGPG